MELSTSFIIYAASYRLAIIAIGAMAIGLGYRLFVRGVMPEGGTEAGLEAGHVKLNLKNAAPGTCFALFGASIVGVMLYQTNPELLLERRDAEGMTTTQRLRGDEDATLGGLVKQPELDEVPQRESGGAMDEAIAQHAGALARATSLDRAAVAISALAAAYVGDQDGADARLSIKALALSEVVYQIDPESAGNLATMARARWRLDERDQAVQAMTEAARLDQQFADDLVRMKDGGL